MNFDIVELAVLHEALQRYKDELIRYRKNHTQHDFQLDIEIKTDESLQSKIKSECQKKHVDTTFL
jgi:hypothetical protein